MSIRQIPSITALRTFESAARTGNFTRAASELHVTPGAVSRIVKELELQVGSPLFVREAKRIALTPAGKRYHEAVADALLRLGEATAELTRARDESKLFVTMLPSVAAKLIAPNFSGFVAKHPEIELHISASRAVANLDAECYDAAIRYGRGNWSEVDAVLLREEAFLPVCSPAFAARHRLRKPAALLKCPLLHADELATWQEWFRAAGLQCEAPAGPVFNEATALIQAAIEGAGVALGRSLLVARDLADGRLVAPFSIAMPAQFAYWFVTPKRRPAKAAALVFRAWLQEQLPGPMAARA